MDSRLLQVSPWRANNPQRTTGGSFIPELWSAELLRQMSESMKLRDMIDKEYEDVVRTGLAVVRIKPKS